MIKTTKQNLPTHAYTRPLFFSAAQCGVDAYGEVEYELKLLDFFTCRQNIIDMYTLPGCKTSSIKIRLLESCDDWASLSALSGYAIPTLP